MKNNLLIKYYQNSLKEYILIFLTATIFLFTANTKSFSEENVFTINNVEVSGIVDLKFSRDSYINRALVDSFYILTSKILLSKDLNKVKDINLKKIKNLINHFQVLEESYSQEIYKITVKIFYDDKKVKKYLRNKNISFSQPESITALFYPVLLLDNKIQSFDNNYFYNNWAKVKIQNETINFLLPIEDLDDFSKINKMKNKIEDLNINTLVNKYDVKSYIFSLMDFQNKKLNINLKINFNSNIINKNFSYDIENINNKKEMNKIIEDLKLKIIDIWKEENLINLLMPLSINIKYQHRKIDNLNKLRKNLENISIINSYNLEEFNINNSFFKIYYYGSPKKLKRELAAFGYQLENSLGYWQLYLNE